MGSEHTSTAPKTALRSLKELDELDSQAPSTSAGTWLPRYLPQALQALVLLGGAAAASAVSMAGLSVLAYLLATHAFTPAQLHYTRALPLDLVGTDLVAQASMLPAGQPPPPNVATAAARFLPPGQQVDVWIDMVVPGPTTSVGTGRGELAHVVAELVSLDGRTAARASQPALLQGRRWGPGRLASSPLRWLGLLDDMQVVAVQLFKGYKERGDVPFAAFQVAIKSRAAAAPSEVMQARVRVRLRTGLVRRVLYMLRPWKLLALLLGAAAVVAVGGGAGAAVLCVGLLLYLLWAPAQGEQSAPDDNSSGSGELELAEDSTGATSPDGEDDGSEEEAEAVHGRRNAEWLQKLMEEPAAKGRPLPGDSTDVSGSSLAPSSVALHSSVMRHRRGGFAA